LLIDPLGRGIECGVRAVEADAGPNQIEEQTAGWLVGRQSLERTKGQGMVRDNQVHSLVNRLGGDCRSHGQARHHPRYLLQPVADQQADIVPLCGQSGRSEHIEKVAKVRHRSHRLAPGRRNLPLLGG
jgi:hypothetical protein